MGYDAGKYDIAVIGAGHAGIEAAFAAARLGMRTVLFTLNMDAVANMPCNPCLGGSAKGHLIKEIDALGGEMAKVGDVTGIQFRTLNLSRGPAVHAARVQSDRRAYSREMKRRLERQPNLDLKQAEIVALERCEGGLCAETRLGARYFAKKAIVASGTYLRGRIIVGDVAYDGGPDGMFAANALSDSLRRLGVKLLRFKTGTPARINRRSIDFSGLERQDGDERIAPLSFEHTAQDTGGNRACCYLTYTNEKTHEIIRANIGRSPIYSGKIHGIGPRYCPSIEDKIMRFSDKERHQLFIEPMGLDTEEMYLQGCSSSLPEEVQIELMRSIKGLEKAEAMRPAYAIEYDLADPLQLRATLEFKDIPNLYGAGQFNGTSGYEEAAAQGLMAGINAALSIKGEPPLILERSCSYIGTLIDDLVTKGTDEPYRMMTSRSEYRLLLRQDNADFRLTPIGYRIGLISRRRYESFCEKKQAIRAEIERLKKTLVPPSEQVNAFLESIGEAPIANGIRLSELLKRPAVTYKNTAAIDKERPRLSEDYVKEAETEIKYAGYIERQTRQAEKLGRLDRVRLPADIDYANIGGLRTEARQKLARLRPDTLGAASRISGVNPADVAVLSVYLKR